MKILIADDDAVIRTLVQRIAVRSSHDVLQARSGPEALELAELVELDLLIVDFHLPDLNGLGLIDEIRRVPGYRRLPIMCLLSLSDPDAVSAIIARHVSDIVLKPVRPADLAIRIDAVIARERHWKARATPRSVPRVRIV